MRQYWTFNTAEPIPLELEASNEKKTGQYQLINIFQPIFNSLQ